MTPILHQIEAACKDGLSIREIADILGIDAGRTSRDVWWLMSKNRLFKVGPMGRRKYFNARPTPEQIAAVEAEAAAQRAEAIRVSGMRSRQAGYAEWKAKREAEKAAAKLERERIKAAKKVPTGISKYTVIRTEKKPTAKAPEIVIPKGVKITVCRPCQVERYRFDPPKGWKGEITRDWLDQRLKAA